MKKNCRSCELLEKSYNITVKQDWQFRAMVSAAFDLKSGGIRDFNEIEKVI